MLATQNSSLPSGIERLGIAEHGLLRNAKWRLFCSVYNEALLLSLSLEFNGFLQEIKGGGFSWGCARKARQATFEYKTTCFSYIVFKMICISLIRALPDQLNAETITFYVKLNFFHFLGNKFQEILATINHFEHKDTGKGS